MALAQGDAPAAESKRSVEHEAGGGDRAGPGRAVRESRWRGVDQTSGDAQDWNRARRFCRISNRRSTISARPTICTRSGSARRFSSCRRVSTSAFPSIVGPFSVFDARATASQTRFRFQPIRKYQGSKVERRSREIGFRRDEKPGERSGGPRVPGDAAGAGARSTRRRPTSILSQALLTLARTTKGRGNGNRARCDARRCAARQR